MRVVRMPLTPKNRLPTHPGVHLRRAISQSDLPHKEVVGAMGISCEHLNAIMEGRESITSHIALRLERTLGVSAGFWLNSQLAWDSWRDA